MLEPLEGRQFHLIPADTMPMNARFESVDFERSAVACAPVENAGLAACVFKPTPMLNWGDLNRLVIYGLLLAAPLLAVFGLVGVIRRVQQEKADAEAKIPTPAALEQSTWTAFEVAGVIGLWRWNPRSQLLTVGAEAGALVGAIRHGDMTLDEFTSMIADDDRKRALIQAAIERARAAQRLYLRGRPPTVIIDLDKVRMAGKDTGATNPRAAREALPSAAAMREASLIGARIGCPIEQTPEARMEVTRQLGAFKTSLRQRQRLLRRRGPRPRGRGLERRRRLRARQVRPPLNSPQFQQAARD